MLCPTGAALNGSHVSHSPVLRSTRCTPEKPLFCVHTLPSTPILSGLVMLTWVLGRFHSAGIGHTCTFSVFVSTLAMAAWYIMPTHRFSSRSMRIESAPRGEPFLISGVLISTSFPVFGSNLPMFWSPKSVYQTVPFESTTTSCGCIVGRGMSHSVMMTRVARPLGRGKGLSSYGHAVGLVLWLWLIEAKYSALARNSLARSSPTRSVSRPVSRFCGLMT